MNGTDQPTVAAQAKIEPAGRTPESDLPKRVTQATLHPAGRVPVAVLCGGRGTRLGGAGQKCLSIIEGRPFLAYRLDQLVRHGATELHLLVAYRAPDVEWLVRRAWRDVPVTYHHDDGIGAEAAHRQAVPDLSFVHWLTYGDVLLDAPLRHSMYPYVYVNDAFPTDAGLRYCWGLNTRFLPRRTTAQSHHINTPADLEEARAYLRRHRIAR